MDTAAIEKSLSDKTIELAKASAQVSTLTEDVAKAKADLVTLTKERDDLKKKFEDQSAELLKEKTEKQKLVEKAADAELASEVEKTYPKSKGTTAEKVAKLKVIKAVSDEAVKKGLLDTWAQEEAFAKANGTEKGSADDVNKSASSGDPQKDFDAGVAKMAVEKKMTVPAATGEYLKTKEGKELYAKISEKTRTASSK